MYTLKSVRVDWYYYLHPASMTYNIKERKYMSHGFTKINEMEIREMGSIAHVYRHDKTRSEERRVGKECRL